MNMTMRFSTGSWQNYRICSGFPDYRLLYWGVSCCDPAVSCRVYFMKEYFVPSHVIPNNEVRQEDPTKGDHHASTNPS